MDFESNDEVSIEDYLQMIALKTAVLLAASLYIGAIIGKASKENAERLYAFGKNMGIAFQLQDDYLDVYGDSEKVGKQTGGDIISNKKTFLLLKAFALADEVTRIELQNLLMYEQDMVLKVKKVKAIYNKLAVKNYSEEIMKFYFNQGLKCLEAIQVEESKKSKLLEFANKLLLREH
jgi:geranylgeranyl diphosphate synthase type II